MVVTKREKDAKRKKKWQEDQPQTQYAALVGSQATSRTLGKAIAEWQASEDLGLTAAQEALSKAQTARFSDDSAVIGSCKFGRPANFTNQVTF